MNYKTEAKLKSGFPFTCTCLFVLIIPLLISCAGKPSLQKTVPDVTGLESKYVQLKKEKANNKLSRLRNFPLKEECDLSYLQDGFKMHYVSKGEGEPLILIHGYPANTFEWRKNINALSKKFQVYAIDQRGFGLSEKPENGDFKIPSYIFDLKAFMDALELEKVHLVGNSFGGGVAWGAAYAFPERIKSLVLIDSIAYPFDVPLQFELLKMPGAGMFLGTFPRSCTNWVLEDLCYHDNSKINQNTRDGYSAQVYYSAARNTMTEFIRENNPRDYKGTGKLLQEIHTPTLIIWGENDQLVPLEHAYRLHEDIPNSQLKIIPECGHIPVEEKPDIVNWSISEFIQETKVPE